MYTTVLMCIKLNHNQAVAVQIPCVTELIDSILYQRHIDTIRHK